MKTLNKTKDIKRYIGYTDNCMILEDINTHQALLSALEPYIYNNKPYVTQDKINKIILEYYESFNNILPPMDGKIYFIVNGRWQELPTVTNYDVTDGTITINLQP